MLQEISEEATWIAQGIMVEVLKGESRNEFKEGCRKVRLQMEHPQDFIKCRRETDLKGPGFSLLD